MEERYKSMIVADLMLKRTNQKTGKEEVLLALRKNTGFNDGEYELPGGHVDSGEDLFDAMIREAKEELNIEIKREDLKIEHMLHHYKGDRINFVFSTKKYKGKLSIGEPDKCEKLEWFDFENLPENMYKKAKKVVQEINDGIFYDNSDFLYLK